MYNENNVKVNIDWKNILIKLALVIIFVLLIIWLFPVPKLDTFYNKVYNDNLSTMKEASESYFVGDKLPSKTGESVTIKLQDMLDKKLVTSFTDKNNNQCSNTNSYAQVTKTESNNYVLKVQLSCDEKTDYVLENLNTTGVIANNTINNNTNSNDANNTSNNSDEKSNKDSEDDGIEIDEEHLVDYDNKYSKGGSSNIEYQYKKAITKTTTTYVCPDGFVKDGNVCYRYDTKETIKATPLYFNDVVSRTNAKKNSGGQYTKYADTIKTIDKTEKICPEGYTLNGNICYKYTNATIVPGTTKLTCPDSYELKGEKCVKTVPAEKTVTPGQVYYTCDKGGTLNGTTCTYTASYRNGSTTYTCPDGFSDNGSNCVKTVSYTGQYHPGTTTYGNCPAGQLANGGTCYYYALQNKTWSNPTVQTSSTQLTVYENATSKRVLVNHSCTLRGCTYTYYYYTAIIKYTCPYGGSLSGTNCVSSRPVTTSQGYYTCNDGSKQSSSTCYTKQYAAKIVKTTQGSYYCPNGGSLSGTTCTYNATYHKAGDKTETYCPAGWTHSGKNCVHTIDATKETTETKYTCPTGYVQEGTTCYQYTEPTTKYTYKYDCPAGYTKSSEGESTICYMIVKSSDTYYCEGADETLEGDQCVKTVKGGLRGYSCPQGYILNKDECVLKTLECAQPEEVTNSSTTYEYTWSSDPNLAGWTQTGKTRTTGTSEGSSNPYQK